jgi:hypothetical protein
MTVDNKPMGEIYHNGCMYDYIYNLYVYNNSFHINIHQICGWKARLYNQLTAIIMPRELGKTLIFVLGQTLPDFLDSKHYVHQLLQTVTTIDHQLWTMIACGPLPFLDGTVGHTCTFLQMVHPERHFL